MLSRHKSPSVYREKENETSEVALTAEYDGATTLQVLRF
jgi:hypothetical protein